VDLDGTAAVNRGDFSKLPDLSVLVPTSQDKGLTWRYTIEKPADDWFKPDFDDANWKEGEGGFGTENTPGTTVRTEWTTSDVWIRRECALPDRKLGELLLLMHHDEDAEVYLNGILAAGERLHVGYEEFPISPEAMKALKPGRTASPSTASRRAAGSTSTSASVN
jgi:hypothetical protein